MSTIPTTYQIHLTGGPGCLLDDARALLRHEVRGVLINHRQLLEIPLDPELRFSTSLPEKTVKRVVRALLQYAQQMLGSSSFSFTLVRL
jgi:hypothetical protein